MLNPVSLQLRVGVDVGSRCHTVAIGLSDGSLLEEFEIPHTQAGFDEFFTRVNDNAPNVKISNVVSSEKGKKQKFVRNPMTSAFGGKAD